MTTNDTTTAPTFELHKHRGPFNALFFRMLGPTIEKAMREQKLRVFTDLPRGIVELGSGVGANLGYVPSGATLIAIEPNIYMHDQLRAEAARRGVKLDLRDTTAEHTGLADNSVDTVISSLVLCTVRDPQAVLNEIQRILRPGGTYRFAEHVVAKQGTFTRVTQRLSRRPWAWTFEGCSCERDLEQAIRGAGFASVEVEHYRIHTPFTPFNTHIAGIAKVD